MTKEEKHIFVKELADQFREHPNFYIIDTGGFNAQKTHKFRAKCHASNLKVQIAKNKLIRKSLDLLDDDYEPLYPILKETSAIIFVNDNPNLPAKLIKEFRGDDERPRLKGAYIEQSVFIGDSCLEQLTSLKSKNELIGDIVGLLQSPAKNVISALKSSGQKIAGILKAIEEKNS